VAEADEVSLQFLGIFGYGHFLLLRSAVRFCGLF
jgi:hypothetical protein